MTSNLDQHPADLVEIAEVVLQSAGFALARTDTETGLQVLVGENAYCVLALAQVPEVAAVAEVDDELNRVLVEAANSANLLGKRWDMYAVLLAAVACA